MIIQNAAPLPMLLHPQVALIFAPDYPFSIGTGFKGMVGFDLAGVVARCGCIGL